MISSLEIRNDQNQMNLKEGQLEEAKTVHKLSPKRFPIIAHVHSLLLFGFGVKI